MTPQAVLALSVVIALPLIWLRFEFTDQRGARISLGLAAIASSFLLAWFVGILSQFSYNSWYGIASKSLIDTMIVEIEDGNIDRVMGALRMLQIDYHPTYENRARYDELVKEAVRQMRPDEPKDDPNWDVGPVSPETWNGHWDDDSGFWLVIDSDAQNLRAARAGDNAEALTNVVLSPDARTLTFDEGNQWRHSLQIVNKYAAKHTWIDAETGEVRSTNTLHKLIRAIPKQRPITQVADGSELALP